MTVSQKSAFETGRRESVGVDGQSYVSQKIRKRGVESRPLGDQEQLQRLEHQLRNVFTVIISNAEMMDRAAIDPALHRRLATIHAGIEECTVILEEIRGLLSGQTPTKRTG